MMVKLTKIDERALISKITKNKGKGKDDEINENKDEKKTEKKILLLMRGNEKGPIVLFQSIWESFKFGMI